jgi:hypothetical protein
MESRPIVIMPGAEVTVTTVLAIRIPAGGYAYDPDCGYDQLIQPRYFRADGRRSGPEGLTAEYFNNPGLHGTAAVVRRDSNISPYWDTGAPVDGIRPDSFSVRWTGSILPPRTGQYGFSLVADDRARLFLGDTLLLDCWDDSWNVTRTASIALESGKTYDLRIEYAELTGWAGMRCRWSVPPAVPDKPTVAEGVQDIFTAITTSQKSLHADAMGATRAYWNKTSTIDARDSVLQRLFDHARFALPGMVGSGGLMDAGVFEYGTQWVRDGSNVALGLIHAGHFESARALLGYVLDDLVTADGTTFVSGGIDAPDREEFDQMGELVHALKAYLDWTGDSSLIVNSRAKLVAMIERPLEPRFRDSTRMVHNRREYWERTFDDAYELAYQTLMVRGLRDAADLSGVLGVPEKADPWRVHADQFLDAMLHHPSRSLVDRGALIKRRNVDGSIADLIPGPQPAYTKDDPYTTEAFHRLNPDASYALPIVLRVVDPRSELSRKTLDRLEEIWNARWTFGGYERYHSSSQQDQPGPWTFATASIARAQHDAGLHARSRRSLEWLLQIQGGNAGAWFEEIPLIRSQMPTSGIVPWTSAEVVLFMVRHWLGLAFEGNDLVLRPSLFPQNSGCSADLRFRSSRIRLELDGSGAVSHAMINGRKILPRKDGSIVVPREMMSGEVAIAVKSR